MHHGRSSSCNGIVGVDIQTEKGILHAEVQYLDFAFFQDRGVKPSVFEGSVEFLEIIWSADHGVDFGDMG